MSDPSEYVVTDHGLVGDGTTDNTVAWATLKAAAIAAGGGRIVMPVGGYFFSAGMDRTNCDGLEIIGDGYADGAGNSAVILASGVNGLDVSGSSGSISNIQIGSDGQKWPKTTMPNGILMAQTMQRPGDCTKCNLKDTFLTGVFTGFSLLGIGITDLDMENVLGYNRTGGNAVMAFMRSNRYGFGSAFSTIITPDAYPTGMGSGDINLRGKSELHDEKYDGSRSNGCALLLFDTGVFRISDGALLSSSATNAVIQMYSDFGTGNKLQIDAAFSSQVGGPPNYCYAGDAGSNEVMESQATREALQDVDGKSTGTITFENL